VARQKVAWQDKKPTYLEWVATLQHLLQLKAPEMVATTTAYELLHQAVVTDDIEYILWAVLATIEEAQQKCKKSG